MAQAGYSGTPLVQKLGIRPGARIAFVSPPTGYDTTLGALPDVERLDVPGSSMDFIQIFSDSADELDKAFPSLRDRLVPTGMLWVSWPKKASGAPTDLDGNVVRSIGLRHGLVDVKVCAIDATWSGLKFVRRTTDR